MPSKGGRHVAAILEGASGGDIELVYLLGADEIDTNRLGKAFVVYQGHHGDKGAHRADVVLPGAAYTEKDGLYVNTEGRVQMGFAATFPLGEAREDWKIVRALSDAVGQPLPFDDLGALRQALMAEHDTFAAIDTIEPAPWGAFGASGGLEETPFVSPIENFYMTDPDRKSVV